MFTIRETKTVTETLYYEVEADSLDEAMAKVQNGEWEEEETFYDDVVSDSEFECINQYEK